MNFINVQVMIFTDQSKCSCELMNFINVQVMIFTDQSKCSCKIMKFHKCTGYDFH